MVLDAMTEHHNKKRTVATLSAGRCCSNLVEKSIDHFGCLNKCNGGDLGSCQKVMAEDDLTIIFGRTKKIITPARQQFDWFGSCQPSLVYNSASEQVVEGIKVRKKPPIFCLITRLERRRCRGYHDCIVMYYWNRVGDEGRRMCREAFVRTPCDQFASFCHPE